MGAIGHAATGGGALRGIYQHNPIILLYGNIAKYIAISEILNPIYCSTCIPLKSMFRQDRRHCTCFHWCRGTRRHLPKCHSLSHLYITEINVPLGPAPLHMPPPVEGHSEASTKIML